MASSGVGAGLGGLTGWGRRGAWAWGAGASGAVAAAGTKRDSPHFGHLTRLPAAASGAFILLPQAGHDRGMGMGGGPEKRGASNPTPLKEPLLQGATEQRPADAPCGARSERCL